ncbi:GAD-like domain-containing protein [Nocardia tengchongensis]|uniref:GAD-like domain-containing protein n=1 Tax=Nocardia tengchongensis TaxID=2055889 RepID=UPI0036AC323A
MSFPITEVTETWGHPTTTTAVPAERFEQYGERVPGYLLDLWRELGFAGFRHGLLWLCDPEQWQPVVDAWTDGLDLPFGTDTWIAVSRSAFGAMSLWGQRTGMSLTIRPWYGWISPFDKSADMEEPFDRDVQILSSLVADAYDDALDLDADDDKLLFKRVLKRLGPVGSDTMYGFVPAIGLGGAMMPERVEIVDAAVHLQLLRQTTPRTILNNPYL